MRLQSVKVNLWNLCFVSCKKYPNPLKGRLLSCFFLWIIYVYFLSLDTAMVPGPQTGAEEYWKWMAIGLGIAFTVAALVIVALICIICRTRRGRKQGNIFLSNFLPGACLLKVEVNKYTCLVSPPTFFLRAAGFLNFFFTNSNEILKNLKMKLIHQKVKHDFTRLTIYCCVPHLQLFL